MRSRIDDVLKLKVRARDGVLVPLSEVVQAIDMQRDYPIYHKDLLPVVYVFGDMAGKTGQPAVRHVRHQQQSERRTAGARRETGKLFLQTAWRPICGICVEMGRRMAGDLRDLPRHGHRLRRRACC